VAARDSFIFLQPKGRIAHNPNVADPRSIPAPLSFQHYADLICDSLVKMKRISLLAAARYRLVPDHYLEAAN